MLVALFLISPSANYGETVQKITEMKRKHSLNENQKYFIKTLAHEKAMQFKV